MTSGAVELAHAMPGRVRLRLADLRGNSALGRDLEAVLRGVEGIKHVGVNLLTGSLLVAYDPDVLTDQKQVFTAAQSLGLLPEGFDGDAQDAGRQLPPPLEPGEATAAAKYVGELARSMNSSVSEAMQGVADLRTIIPFVLLALGVVSLRRSPLPLPPWYTLFYYAFSVFRTFRV